MSDDDDGLSTSDPRDYDVDHHVRILRDNFATRLARAFEPEDYAVVFADPDQLSLFGPVARGHSSDPQARARRAR